MEACDESSDHRGCKMFTERYPPTIISDRDGGMMTNNEDIFFFCIFDYVLQLFHELRFHQHIAFCGWRMRPVIRMNPPRGIDKTDGKRIAKIDGDRAGTTITGKKDFFPGYSVDE